MHLLELARPFTTGTLEDLAAHLDTHRDALTSGRSSGPKLLLKVIWVLHAAGYPVTRPACAGCGKVRQTLPVVHAEGRLCNGCNRKARHTVGTCARCGRENIRLHSKQPGGDWCQACYLAQKREPCRECGRNQRVSTRLPDGTSLCPRCHAKPEEPCDSCASSAFAEVRPTQMCPKCFNGFRRARRFCGSCGELRVIVQRARNGEPDLCQDCYHTPEAVCHRCGRTRPCYHARTDNPVCGPCTERPAATCTRCRRQRPISAHWPLGAVCQTCYLKILHTPAECAGCHGTHPLTGQVTNGAGLCGPCAGYSADYACASCGRTGYLHAAGRCAYCVLDDRLHTLLTGPDGQITAQLRPLLEVFSQVDNPADAIERCAGSPSLRLLGQLAAYGTPLTHESLDGFGSGMSVNYLRDLLVHSRVLPPQADDAERTPAWLEAQLATRPAHHGTLMRPFLHWFLLKRARRRATNRPYKASDEYGLRARLGQALHLLKWLDDQRLAIDALNQHVLDTWLSEGTTARRDISYFLTWTAARRLTGSLTVPPRPADQPTAFLDEDDQWLLLQRCLTDTTLPLDTRCIAPLTLLYGLPLQRLRHLTCDQLERTNRGDTVLKIGSSPLPLPPPLADLLTRLATAPPPRRRSAFQSPGGETQPAYLFPGVSPGRPVSPQTIRSRLKSLGITARPTRNSALVALASDFPAVIVADYLGMHISTTTRWVNYIRKDWATYVAARTEDTMNRAGSSGTGKPTLVHTPGG
ncbi:hypothetical protein [Streptomyces sp. ODS05-4]|uniref:hypothetical protein n=1 Tax=Streptomyces sp. ODS05-4 TaxID=2944939 RepID=UPI00210EFCE4|nr:hypothetical protein [Streptomyces sp. ODS05-4]